MALWLSRLLVKTSKCSCKSEIFLGNWFLCLKVEVMVDIFPYKQTYTFKLIEKYSDSVGRLLETSSRRHRKRGKWCVCAEKEVSAHNGAWLYVVWRGGAVISTAVCAFQQHTHTQNTLLVKPQKGFLQKWDTRRINVALSLLHLYSQPRCKLSPNGHKSLRLKVSRGTKTHFWAHDPAETKPRPNPPRLVTLWSIYSNLK